MSKLKNVTWVLEKDIFPHLQHKFHNVANDHGVNVITWNDDWLIDDAMPKLTDQAVIFHGSLNVASAIARKRIWKPGTFIDDESFNCTNLYRMINDKAFNSTWAMTTVNELISNTADVLAMIGSPERVFVRPDGPFKQFSGRVLKETNITLKSLDHGYYYDDLSTRVIVAPERKIDNEARYVIVNNDVVASSSYKNGHETFGMINHQQLSFVKDVVKSLKIPQDVYVLDACESSDKHYVLELNPFSGADLYGCDLSIIVDAVLNAVTNMENE